MQPDKPAPAPTLPDRTGNDLAFWCALLRTKGIGPATGQKLLQRFPSPKAVFNASQSELRHAGLTEDICRQLLQPDWGAVEQDLRWLEQSGNHIITLNHPEYPALLQQISAPPLLLFVHGQKKALQSLQIALVGSRNPSRGGQQTAEQFADHLTQAGLTITSGLASGIDAAGHRGAMRHQGVSIAVTGTGLDRVYPAQHRDLAHQIAERGALVSEFPIGTPPKAENFPRRNRIISGLSLGTLVVEAALKSGSLITAQQALEQGREVFALPGSIHNPLARGCHQLIRQGAKLVETVEDIVTELIPLASYGLTAKTDAGERKNGDSDLELDPEYQNMLKYLGYEPTPIDLLVEQTGLTSEQVSSMLLILELRDYVASSPGGLYSRVQK